MKSQDIKKVRRDLALLLHEKRLAKKAVTKLSFFINTSNKSSFEMPLPKSVLAASLKLKPYVNAKNLEYTTYKFPLSLTCTKNSLELMALLTSKMSKRIYFAQIFFLLFKQHLQNSLLFKSTIAIRNFFAFFKTFSLANLESAI